MKLNLKTIAALVLPEGKSEVIVFDEDLSGFGLRIRSGGKRTWIYQFKIGNQNRRVTLGSVAALTPVRARETAGELHAMVRLGRDPAGEKTEGRARAAETVAVTLQTYLGLKRKSLRPKSYAGVERHLMKYAKSLHNLPLAKVDRRAVAARISAIAAERGEVSANRTRASLSAFFAWAMREGLLDNNPVIGTNRQPEKSRSRVLSDDELKIIWDALGPDDYSTVVCLLMLTGQRAGEIAALRWSEIVGDQIVLPPERVKNGRQHTVPLAAIVQAIFDGRPRTDEFVFGRRSGRPFGGWGACKATLDLRISGSGPKLEHWTHHDLRRSMATWLAEHGTPPHIVEAVLNHVSGHKAGVAGVYNRAAYEPQKRAALEKWAAHVEALTSGKRGEATVIKLHG